MGDLKSEIAKVTIQNPDAALGLNDLGVPIEPDPKAAEPAAPADGPAATEPAGSNTEALAGLLFMGWQLVGMKYSKTLEWTEAECAMFAEPLDEVLKKYDSSISLGPEAALLTCGAMIMASKVLAYRAEQSVPSAPAGPVAQDHAA